MANFFVEYGDRLGSVIGSVPGIGGVLEKGVGIVTESKKEELLREKRGEPRLSDPLPPPPDPPPDQPPTNAPGPSGPPVPVQASGTPFSPLVLGAAALGLLLVLRRRK